MAPNSNSQSQIKDWKSLSSDLSEWGRNFLPTLRGLRFNGREQRDALHLTEERAVGDENEGYRICDVDNNCRILAGYEPQPVGEDGSDFQFPMAAITGDLTYTLSGRLLYVYHMTPDMWKTKPTTGGYVTVFPGPMMAAYQPSDELLDAEGYKLHLLGECPVDRVDMPDLYVAPNHGRASGTPRRSASTGQTTARGNSSESHAGHHHHEQDASHGTVAIYFQIRPLQVEDSTGELLPPFGAQAESHEHAQLSAMPTEGVDGDPP